MMRGAFPEYFPPSIEDGGYFARGIIVFDTNVLLDLYRFSAESRDDFLDLIGSNRIRERLWLPYQVAEEFVRGRLSVRKQSQRAIDETRKAIRETVDQLKTKLDKILDQSGRNKEHPHIDRAELMKTLDALIDQANRHVIDSPTSTDEDPVLDRLEAIFTGRAGSRVSDEKRREWAKEARERYSRSVPPGYMDADKSDGRGNGDFFLWKEILGLASEFKKPILLVSNDVKDDWVFRASGQLIGPRPELIREVLGQGSPAFALLTGNRFYDHASAFLRQRPKPETSRELSEASAAAFETYWRGLDSEELNRALIEGIFGEAIAPHPPQAQHQHRLTDFLHSEFAAPNQLLPVPSTSELVSSMVNASEREWRYVRNYLVHAPVEDRESRRFVTLVDALRSAHTSGSLGTSPNVGDTEAEPDNLDEPRLPDEEDDSR